MSRDSFDRDAARIARLDPRARAEVLSAYLDGELSPAAARHVTAWLERDPVALREVEHHRRLWDLLALYGDEVVPESFASRVLDRARESSAPPTGRRFALPGWRRWALTAAAAALVAVGAWLLLPRGPEGASPVVSDVGEAVEAVEAVPAEYLEEVDVLLSLSDEEFEAYLLADLEEPWEDG